MNHSAPQPNPEELSNWAALSALGALAGDDQLAESFSADELDAEIAGFEDAVSAIAYSVPAMPISPKLKERLFQRIDATTLQSAELYALISQPIEELIALSNQLQWQDIEGPGEFKHAVYQTNTLHRELAFFVKSDQGGLFPKHHHAAGEEILVLAGDLVVDDQVYQKGDRIVSAADTIHQPATRNGCLLFCVASMDNQFVS
ncbi:cupin domain-containing protein [Acaryochloris marina]|uniref:ChrR-like cupin domain-containing protein n=1 Tax=Acaryochloris marina (strain MBIC 11017) TaxID=329726 RepID=B0C6N3_ACAM1|nr:cupin domain-containing protein [Acaryochloris marina]ABW27589.1 conserved hypothetical protein [Acaryochloris marina MBIC11017]BDM82324.1 hypothetical protein AM10699_51880 [Acaryochloris marina MBIC10699]